MLEPGFLGTGAAVIPDAIEIKHITLELPFSPRTGFNPKTLTRWCIITWVFDFTSAREFSGYIAFCVVIVGYD